MIGLISTPSTRVAPNTSADSRSRPPPGPMTSAVNPAGPLDELVGEGRELVAQVGGVARLPVPLRIGVEAAESMSMNRDSPREPVNVGLSDQSPCARS